MKGRLISLDGSPFCTHMVVKFWYNKNLLFWGCIKSKEHILPYFWLHSDDIAKTNTGRMVIDKCTEKNIVGLVGSDFVIHLLPVIKQKNIVSYWMKWQRITKLLWNILDRKEFFSWFFQKPIQSQFILNQRYSKNVLNSAKKLMSQMQ